MNKLSWMIRQARGKISRAKFAPILNVSIATLVRIENGKISSNSVKKLANYFEITITEALKLNEDNEQI